MSLRPPWLFRVADAPAAGAGHMARCRALAAALEGFAPAQFMLSRAGGHWRQTLEQEGLRVVAPEDAGNTAWSGSVLDGYDFDRDDAQALRRIAAPLVLIDDLDRAMPEADLIVFPGRPDAAATGDARVLCGPQFALLAAAYRVPPPPRTAACAERVLVSFGARDSKNATALALEALLDCADAGWTPKVGVIMGGQAPHLEAVRTLVEKLGDRGRLSTDVTDMAELLRAADFAIGAGGVSLLERMACGVPSVTVGVADNQIRQSEYAATAGATVYAGPIEQLQQDDLRASMLALAQDGAKRRAIAESGRRLVNGQGTDRVAVAMRALSERIARGAA